MNRSHQSVLGTTVTQTGLYLKWFSCPRCFFSGNTDTILPLRLHGRNFSLELKTTGSSWNCYLGGGNWRTATFLIQSGPSLSLWLSGNISRASKCDWSVRRVRACVRDVNTSVLPSGSNSIPLCAFPPLSRVIKERRGKKNLRTSGRMCATAQSGRGNSSSRRSSKLSACPSDPAEARGGSQRRRKKMGTTQ